MAENDKPAVAIAAAGAPVRGEFPGLKAIETAASSEEGNDAGAAAAANSNGAGNNEDNNSAVDLTEDQLKAFFEKQGVVYEGIDKLKEKLTAPAATAAAATLTDEQKAALEKAKEDKIINQHLSRKGTPEQYVAFKSIAAADKKELGLKREIEDLVELGFTPERATELANDRYFQLTDAEIAAIEDVDQKAEAIKRREAGEKKLERKGSYYQNIAKTYLGSLEKELQDQDELKTKAEQHTSKVEDAVKKFVRQEKIEIGKIDDQTFDPVDFEISDTALASAKELLSDGAKFEENLFTKDGDLNVEFILPHLVRSFSMQEAAKKGFLEGGDRQIKLFDSKFDSKPPKLGGNGNNAASSNKIAGTGQIQYANRPTIN